MKKEKESLDEKSMRETEREGGEKGRCVPDMGKSYFNRDKCFLNSLPPRKRCELLNPFSGRKRV